jgi:hypothetical protein
MTDQPRDTVTDWDVVGRGLVEGEHPYGEGLEALARLRSRMERLEANTKALERAMGHTLERLHELNMRTPGFASGPETTHDQA